MKGWEKARFPSGEMNVQMIRKKRQVGFEPYVSSRGEDPADQHLGLLRFWDNLPGALWSLQNRTRSNLEAKRVWG